MRAPSPASWLLQARRAQDRFRQQAGSYGEGVRRMVFASEFFPLCQVQLYAIHGTIDCPLAGPVAVLNHTAMALVDDAQLGSLGSIGIADQIQVGTGIRLQDIKNHVALGRYVDVGQVVALGGIPDGDLLRSGGVVACVNGNRHFI
ncbi:conserved hypothetical protein [Pseudomonas protegens Pf-5]|uniref:Uncharacterized protein n=1 Tax=Pseudomonas fluorescens (strain ATCC BAA-477 / NRRL B-23932 / Pf-5) TaxID=220664 RepID=Q4KEA6_PSEF5|nr:conserved hypothetical protein [Pseudomonas protegens Pf-5]